MDPISLEADHCNKCHKPISDNRDDYYCIIFHVYRGETLDEIEEETPVCLECYKDVMRYIHKK